MTDAPGHASSPSPSPSPPTSPSSARRLHPPAGSIVRLPIRQRQRHQQSRGASSGDEDDDLSEWLSAAAAAVRPLAWHRKLQGVYLFRYTDFLGRPAVQPAAREPHIRAYFGPAEEEEEEEDDQDRDREGEAGGRSCDAVLLEARRWCCWAQGFHLPEREMRWVLTLVFDLVNVLIARQKAAVKEVGWRTGGYPYCGNGGDAGYGIGAGAGADMGPAELFWLGRYYLFHLINIVADMKDEFGIENLSIPAFAWRSPN
ncbi:hypothetical protein F4818DRAFT_403950 [Hypoxylon cercidicola]|nr:hypothetical protein F4818DRAFT_403950 [Hypoxylon cercidicola]